MFKHVQEHLLGLEVSAQHKRRLLASLLVAEVEVTGTAVKTKEGAGSGSDATPVAAR